MNAVELKNVSFAYEPGHPVINNLNLTFESGTATANVGQNGAGKTTTVKLINHLLRPTAGQVLINGHDIAEKSTAEVSHEVGYSFQNPDDQIFNNSIEKEIAFGPKRAGVSGEELDQIVKQAAEVTGLADYLSEHPYNFPYSLRKFITIASLIAMDPDIYIFDEPTTGQDYKSRARLIKIINQLKDSGKCVIVITHDMEFVAENFQRVIVLSKHHVLEDDIPQKVFVNDKVMADANIDAPQVVQIARSLSVSQDNVPLTVSQLIENVF